MRVALSDLPRLTGHALVDGAFDPLHAGHLAYLASASALAHAPLIVTVASDADVRAKGRDPFLPASQRAEVVDALSLVAYTYEKDRPLEEILEALRPVAYIKGKDWEGKLPPEQIDVCARYGIPIRYVDTVTDSSTARLKAWAMRDGARHLEAFERLTHAQRPASAPWQPVTDYSFEARKQIEGKHPQLIKDVFQPKTVLDVGCGPDGHLIRLLLEVGIQAEGFDIQERRAGDLRIWQGDIAGYTNECGRFDLVVSRECLEHLTVRQLRAAVTNLCKLSSNFVYGTTRFNPTPGHMLDFTTEFDVDPTHITCGTHGFLRMLFALEGFRWRGDLAARMDWMGKGRTFCFERANA